MWRSAPFHNIILIILFHLIATSTTVLASEKVRVKFERKPNDQAITSVGTLKKGDISNLRYELQRYNSGMPTSEIQDERNTNNGYVEKIATLGERTNKKQRIEKANRDLVGHFNVKNEKKLKKVKEKKQKVSQEKGAEKNINSKKYLENTRKSKRTELSKYYKVSSKRLHNGEHFSIDAGNYSLIVTYTIKEGRYKSTYMNLLEGYATPGSNYLLKYHGTGAKRSYYLEYVPKKKKVKRY